MELVHLMSIAIELDAPLGLGAFPLGGRRLTTFRSGTFEGPGGLAGTLEPGGVDWQTTRADGALEIRAHYLLRTDAGEPIEITSDGLRVAAPDVVRRLAAGEPVHHGEYYFRTAVRMSTSSSRWNRLNRMIAVAYGERLASRVAIHVHEVT